MSDVKLLQKSALEPLIGKLRGAGQRVLAPVARQDAGNTLTFAEVTGAKEIAADYVQTTESAKAAVFPRYEAMLRYKLAGKAVEPAELPVAAPPTVLFGVRPCDAASLATLKAVFTWDSQDAYFEPKLAHTTVVSVACTKCDDYCFCTSVGGGPGATAGSDLLLTPLDATKYLVEVLTDEGKALVAMAPELFAAANGEASKKDAALAKVAPKFEAKALAAKLPALFGQNSVWVEQSLRCIGCGACAFVCPTCTCFDIQDERTRTGGVRLRTWDSCGFGLFTLHASGHNPRTKQSERWRQRVMHKFSYQPERLGVLGCVGCGRCSRSCPTDMNLGEHAAALSKL